MNLSIDSLKTIGAFTGAPVEKEVTWRAGDKDFTATVHVRPFGYRTAISDITAHRDQSDAVAGRIAASICDADGNAIFTAADITGTADPERGALDGNLAVALLAAISEVNNLGKTPS